MSSSIVDAVAAAWTNLGPWLTGTGDKDYPAEVNGGKISDFNGSDKNVAICPSNFYPDNTYSYQGSGISVSEFTVGAAEAGTVSTTNPSQVIGPVTFTTLSFSGSFTGTQKCFCGAAPQNSPSTEKVTCNFVYTVNGGVITYTLTVDGTSITVAGVQVTDSKGQSPTGTVSLSNLKEPSNVSSSYVNKTITGEIPNLATSTSFYSLLTSVLQDYITANTD